MERTTMRVQELIGRKVFTANGECLGRVYDLVAEKLGDHLCVSGLMLGPGVWLQRFGWTRTAHGRMVRWEGIDSLEPRITLHPGAKEE